VSADDLFPAGRPHRPIAGNGGVPTVSGQSTGMYTLHYDESFASQLLLYVRVFDTQGRELTVLHRVLTARSVSFDGARLKVNEGKGFTVHCE
jgi:hypothetical protein